MADDVAVLMVVAGAGASALMSGTDAVVLLCTPRTAATVFNPFVLGVTL